MSFLTKLRQPFFHLFAAWISVFLVGANLAISAVAIPLNFRLPEHLPTVASAYGLALFTKFFALETRAFQFLLLCHVFGAKRARFQILDILRMLVIIALVFYFVYQRHVLLPDFQAGLASGADVSSQHQSMKWMEMFKLLCLMSSAIVAQLSYHQTRK